MLISICTGVRGLIVMTMVLGLGGCVGPLAKRLADKEVYPIVEQKQDQALGHAKPFTIEPINDPLTEELLRTAGRATDEFTTTGLRISLSDALLLATRNNRNYQTRKEQLYLSALALTEQRHVFSPIFSDVLAAEYRRSPIIGIPPVGLGEIPGTNTKVLDVRRTGAISHDLAMTKLIAATGARITVGLSQDLLRVFSLPSNATGVDSAVGVASASIVQPLLRGAGARVVTENLRQAERDVIYSVRDFSRFEKTFLIDRVGEYLRLLQQLNVVTNEQHSYSNLIEGRIRAEALAEAGRIDIFQVDQARQQELNARNRWLTAQTNFSQLLDTFRINLGLPTDLNIMPNEQDLQDLLEAGLDPIPMSPEEGIEKALRDRLDFQTAHDQVGDQERKIYVAENALLPDLNVSAQGFIPDDDKNQPLSLDAKRRDYRLGARLELPLDRKLERNDYRIAVINLERSKRAEEQTHDLVIQDVRRAYQQIEQARNSYEIQSRGVEVAQRRVDSSTMLLQASRKTVRDVLESEDDLRNARNNLTRAVVDYTLARLQFLGATESIEVDEQGNWQENTGENIANNDNS